MAPTVAEVVEEAKRLRRKPSWELRFLAKHKRLLFELLDQGFRSDDAARTADQIRYITGWWVPSIAVPLIKWLLRRVAGRWVSPKIKSIEGVQINLNFLGEAILGEDEAEKRLDLYLEALKRPEVDAVSVKISTICSQIDLVGWDATLETICGRLRRLYRAAGSKLVNLDMEEARDLHLTVAAFRSVLSEPEFAHHTAGIALQAYIPESFPIQRELTEWAATRKAPIRIRVVKGANLSMERVTASLEGWEQAPYMTKVETDANFKRMVRYGVEHLDAVRLGVASHNLFDIAYARLLNPDLQLETLHGMMKPLPGSMLYWPVAEPDQFHAAIAYLVRRFDEQTSPDNFLAHTDWDEEAAKFAASLELEPPECSRRTTERPDLPLVAPFRNEPNTDWSIQRPNISMPEVVKPSLTTTDEPLAIAKAYEATWSATDRAPIIREVAKTLRRHRNEIIGVMVMEGKRIIAEADVEISEAIDFCEYYVRNVPSGRPKGTVLVTPPWNFPVSIPTGCVIAGLVTGNCVLFKPAPETPFIGQMLANLMWEAGVPREALHFVHCDEETLGTQLVCDPRVNVVMLTGSTETARHFLKLRPDLDLIAETGGKNAMIISNICDRDQAIFDLVQSAFGHAGQKCSAASLAILHRGLYDDPRFLDTLRDAAASLHVGEAENCATRVPPLIKPPNPTLLRALTDEGPWLLKPRQLSDTLWTPGIKLDVQAGSEAHQTEYFGPLLSVMRAENLDHALELANGTPYGLTSGFHGLDPREQEYWAKQIIAGNLYINRGITGAIVLRQPFGGCKASSFGPGAKAGGPNYLAQLMHLDKEQPHPSGEFVHLLGQENRFYYTDGREVSLSRTTHRYGLL
jgi:RHH-type transcriptional regulator, proline utilization regulon repressor / proline dehydrogenase / delta 1-pyrroline-5-carboxylate dehydrogenase